MTRFCLATVFAVVGLSTGVVVAGAQPAQGVADRQFRAKLDSLAVQLRPYMPNHGTLVAGTADTLVFSSLIGGTRRIPLANVVLAMFPDSSHAGFTCVGGRDCITYDAGLGSNVTDRSWVNQFTWGIGSIRRDANRQNTFQGDPIPYQAVSAALTNLMAQWLRSNPPPVPGGMVGTLSPTAAVELEIRENSLAVLNLPSSRWATVFTAENVTISVDLSGMRSQDGYRLVWVKTVFAPPQKLADGLVSTVIAEQRFDCAQKRTQSIRSVTVIPGEVIAKGRNPRNQWMRMETNPNVSGIIDKVCSASPSGG